MHDQLHALNSWHYGTNMKSILLILSSLVSTFANPEGMIFLSVGIKIRLKQRLRFHFTLTWKKKKIWKEVDAIKVTTSFIVDTIVDVQKACLRGNIFLILFTFLIKL